MNYTTSYIPAEVEEEAYKLWTGDPFQMNIHSKIFCS